MRNRKDEDLVFLKLIHKNRHKGWTGFLEQYSQTILQTIKRFSFDYDETMEIYVYTCEKLAENSCSRLKQFRGEGQHGKSYFSTWLITTTINFCRAWVRQKKGRRRLFEAIKNLTEQEQQIFDLYYWKGYQESEIIEILKAKTAKTISPFTIHQSLNRINQVLTEKNKWKIVSTFLRNQPALSIEKLSEDQGDRFEIEHSAHLKDDPGYLFDSQTTLTHIKEAYATLTEEEQTLLKLRFENGLSARKIGELLKISKYKLIYLKIETVTEKLRQYLKMKGIDSGNCDCENTKFEIFE